MKKYLLTIIALLAIPFAVLAIDQIDLSANAILAANSSMKPDARHAAVAIALVDKAGHTVSLDSSTGQVPLVNLGLIMGSGTLTSGTATIANTAIKTTSKILLAPVGVTNAGFLGIGAIVSGTGFGVLSSSGSDARVFYYLIQN